MPALLCSPWDATNAVAGVAAWFCVWIARGVAAGAVVAGAAGVAVGAAAGAVAAAAAAAAAIIVVFELYSNCMGNWDAQDPKTEVQRIWDERAHA